MNNHEAYANEIGGNGSMEQDMVRGDDTGSASSAATWEHP